MINIKHFFTTLSCVVGLLFPIHIHSSTDVPSLEYIQSGLECLAKAIYYEARGEGHVGMLAVAHVVVNRTMSPKYPSDVCGVIEQKGQFTWTSAPKKIIDHERFHDAISMAWDVLSGHTKDPTKGATMFHSSSIQPNWNRPVKARIRNQVFY